MKKTFITFAAILFAVLTLALLVMPNTTHWLLIPVAAIGGILLYLVWPEKYVKKEVTKENGQQNIVSNGIHIFAMVTMALLMIFQLFDPSAGVFDNTENGGTLFGLAIGVVAISFLITYFRKNTKDRYTIIEFLTMKARDEREQSIINEAARKTYAFVRILAMLVVIGLAFGLFNGFSFSADSFGYLLLLLIFIAHIFFTMAIKKITK